MITMLLFSAPPAAEGLQLRPRDYPAALPQDAGGINRLARASRGTARGRQTSRQYPRKRRCLP